MATSDTEDIFRTFTQQTLTIWTVSMKQSWNIQFMMTLHVSHDF